MSKFVKDLQIREIEKNLKELDGVLVVDMSRMTGVDANRLRVEFGQKSISMLTVKTSLARAACNRVGMESLVPVLKGPATLVWGGEDIVALSREVTAWAKAADTLTIVGGAVEGQSLDEQGVLTLSRSPGRPELLSRIAGAILGPGGSVAGALLGPGGTVAGAIKSIADAEEDS